MSVGLKRGHRWAIEYLQQDAGGDPQGERHQPHEGELTQDGVAGGRRLRDVARRVVPRGEQQRALQWQPPLLSKVWHEMR